MAKHKFELSQRTTSLINCLKVLEKGAELTYPELSRQVGFAVTSTLSNLTYARKALVRDHNSVWVPIRPRIGIRRLSDVEIAERHPGWWLRGSKNKLKNGTKEADVVDMALLSIDEQCKFSVSVIQNNMAQETLNKKTTNRLEKVARGSSNDLPAFTAVEWAISLSPKKKT